MEHIERSLKAFEPPKDGEAEDWVSGQVIAILTIFGLVGVQAAFTKLEEAVEQHKHIQAMLRHGYRELMIMGLIAFIMFVIEKSGAIKNEEALGQFESVHIMLFLLAICFVLLVLALVLLSLHMSSYWEELVRSQQCPGLIECCNITTRVMQQALQAQRILSVVMRIFCTCTLMTLMCRSASTRGMRRHSARW